VPEPGESDGRLTELLDTIMLVTAKMLTTRHVLNTTVGSSLRRKQRVRELHESNRIEDAGPELLAETNTILASKSAKDIADALNRYAVIRSLEVDQRTLDVLGLHGAKLFAEQMSSGSDRPFAETDIRGMHGLIMGKDPCAGRYKQYLNSIAGAEHVPLPPSDTPDAMRALVTWMNRVLEADALPPVVIAATVHAWLAHIHPFDDGNGRIARLLANIVIGSAGLPPLVIRLSADRNQYLGALAISDQGGDLAPLIGVFLRVMRRALDDMADPAFAIRLFEDEIRLRSESQYVQWRTALLGWLQQLGAALRLHDLDLRTDPAEMISQESFARIRRGAREGLVVGGIGSSRYHGSRAYLLLDKTELLFRYSNGEPALSFLRYGPMPWSKTVYTRLGGGIAELIVRPDPTDGVYIRTSAGRSQQMTGANAAEVVAAQLAADFRSGLAEASFVDWSYYRGGPRR
jgi:Fic family protein